MFPKAAFNQPLEIKVFFVAVNRRMTQSPCQLPQSLISVPELRVLNVAHTTQVGSDILTGK